MNQQVARYLRKAAYNKQVYKKFKANYSSLPESEKENIRRKIQEVGLQTEKHHKEYLEQLLNELRTRATNNPTTSEGSTSTDSKGTGNKD